jgi:hypothetical protein
VAFALSLELGPVRFQSDSTRDGVGRALADPTEARSRRMLPDVVPARHPARSRALLGRFTRLRPAVERRVPSPVESGKNNRPAMLPDGLDSHRRTVQPRSGRAASNRASNLAIRRRFVVVSPTTSSQLTDLGSRPRSRASLGATRTLRSSGASVPWASGTTDFTFCDQQAPRSLVPAEGVDGAAIAVVIERDLEPRLPAVPFEERCQPIHDRGVGLVEESVKALTAPSHPYVQIGTEREAHRLDPTDIGRAREPTLEIRDERPRRVRAKGDIDLAETEPDPDRPQRSTDPERIEHTANDPSVGSPGAYVTPASTSCPMTSSQGCMIEVWPASGTKTPRAPGMV